MRANKYDRHGNVEIAFNTQNEAILSFPDGILKLLPCEVCLELKWKPLNVVSFLCPDCLKTEEQDPSFDKCPACGKPLIVERQHKEAGFKHLDGYVAHCGYGPCNSIAGNNGQFGYDPKQAMLNLQRAVEAEEEKRQG